MSEDPRSWIAGMFHHRSTNWLAGVLEDEAGALPAASRPRVAEVHRVLTSTSPRGIHAFDRVLVDSYDDGGAPEE
jgi:hypothetical protein